STGPGNPPYDMSGAGLAEETITGDCPGDNYPITRFEIFEITQTENDLSVKLAGSDESFTGTFSGSQVTWTMAVDEDDGTLNIEFTGKISGDGLTINGEAEWIWTSEDETSSCGGSTAVQAKKLLSPSVDVTGVWDGTWTSTAHQINGSFSVNLVQDSSILTGYIDIPDIGLYNAALKGAVSGDYVTFGDIDDIIKFTGTIGSDTISASGAYIYPGYGDQGSWQAEKSGGTSNGFRVSIIDEFEVMSGWQNIQDVTWDGSHFWIRGHDKIYQFSTTGELTDSILCPGEYPEGITFDGTYLINADTEWGTGLIYKLDPEGNSVYKSPGSGQIVSLDFDGEYLWGIDEAYSNLKIYKINSDGFAVDSINCPGDMAGGLACMGNYYWVSAFNMGSTFIYGLNSDGEIVHSAMTDDFFPGSLVGDGTYVYYFAGSIDSVLRIDSEGNSVYIEDMPVISGKDITYDGNDFWVITGDVSMDSALVHHLSSSGEILATIRAAGHNPGGLAYDGQYLRQADVVSKRIYRLNKNGGNFYSLPSMDFDFLDCNGSSFWAASSLDNTIFNFNYDGNILTYFDGDYEECAGLAVDENSIWIVARYSDKFIYQFEASGNLLASYQSDRQFPDPAGLTYDGQNFWYLGFENENNVWKMYKLELKE
ncbi:MAG: hypothetical protein P8X42_11210, partial [Calditrichaceae bacterium]